MIAVGYPVFLGSELILGRDYGDAESLRCRASLAHVVHGREEGGSGRRCGRPGDPILLDSLPPSVPDGAVDELERRVAAVEPEVRAARGWPRGRRDRPNLLVLWRIVAFSVSCCHDENRSGPGADRELAWHTRL